MKQFAKKLLLPCYRLLARLLMRAGYEIQPRSEAAERKRLQQVLPYLGVVGVSRDYLRHSRSQHGQDLLVVALTGHKRGEGFFVEFGAVDGLQNSNSLYLEKALAWEGIVSEPARRWHDKLRANRGCHVDTRCVFSETGRTFTFGETGAWMGGNTLLQYKDEGGNEREFSATYEVETVSLNDLLREGRAPAYIDFLSVDTEGSEHEILQAVDFSAWSFGLILVEHNFDTEKRSRIENTLTRNGYQRLPVPVETAGVDDWYARPELAERYAALVGNSSRF
jgi:FkbM family methyltransferase